MLSARGLEGAEVDARGGLMWDDNVVLRALKDEEEAASEVVDWDRWRLRS